MIVIFSPAAADCLQEAVNLPRIVLASSHLLTLTATDFADHRRLFHLILFACSRRAASLIVQVFVAQSVEEQCLVANDVLSMWS